ncbi:MAG: GAF domain-containing protein [Arenimonas sp.]
MPARLTAYLPDEAAATCLMREPQRVRIGRGIDCEFRFEHPSVSREHAELIWQDGRWHLSDSGSKNGSFVDGVRIAASTALKDRTWLRIGDILCEFNLLSSEAAEQYERRMDVRRANSLILLDKVLQKTDLPDLLQETVRATLQLTECDRGFLLLADKASPTALTVAASHGIDPSNLRSREFRGSAGAVQRALNSRSPVVINDLRLDPELAGRASVIAGNLRSLICLPLFADGEAVGLVYADSSRADQVITQMDLELLKAFAERAALWIAARRCVAAIGELSANPSWAGILEAQQRVSA